MGGARWLDRILWRAHLEQLWLEVDMEEQQQEHKPLPAAEQYEGSRIAHWQIRGLAGGVRMLEQLTVDGFRPSEQETADLTNLAERMFALADVAPGEPFQAPSPPRSYL